MQPVAPARADQRHDVLAARQHPGDRELRDASRRARRRPRAARRRARGCARGSRPGSAGCVRAEVAAAERSRSRAPVAAEQPAREHAVGGDADAELAARRAGSRPRCPREISEYSICRSPIGCTAAARRIVSGADLREADVAHVAGLHQLGDRADRLLDRHVRIEPRRAVDVDVVGAEPRSACRRGSS